MLKIENLNVSYGKIKVLKNLSLEVKMGEVVTLIGANGAGKTTLLKAISGIIPIEGGVLSFSDGTQRYDLQKLETHEIVKLKIGHVPEGRMVFPNLTVKENLELGAYLRRDKQNLTHDFEDLFLLFPRLKERLTQTAGTLSGGEQQMLAIGRALMLRPRLLLMDEPSLGLAPLLVRDIFRNIQDINRKGVTILLVEQNARMALKISHRAYVIETGEIKLQGPSPEILANADVKKAYLGG